jgi:hypothetical protein
MTSRAMSQLRINEPVQVAFRRSGSDATIDTIWKSPHPSTFYLLVRMSSTRCRKAAFITYSRRVEFVSRGSQAAQSLMDRATKDRDVGFCSAKIPSKRRPTRRFGEES